jgi:hypothetical protein
LIGMLRLLRLDTSCREIRVKPLLIGTRQSKRVTIAARGADSSGAYAAPSQRVQRAYLVRVPYCIPEPGPGPLIVIASLHPAVSSDARCS